MQPYLEKRPRNLKLKKKRPLSEEIKTTSKILIITLFCLALVSGISFIYLSSLKPAKGYVLKQLQLDYEQLQIENKELEKKIDQAKAAFQIEESEIVSQMVEPEKSQTSYVEESNLASNR